jgi:hypothetical protein
VFGANDLWVVHRHVKNAPQRKRPIVAILNRNEVAPSVVKHREFLDLDAAYHGVTFATNDAVETTRVANLPIPYCEEKYPY